MSITLICYIAASSVAVVYAFPITVDTPQTSTANSIKDMKPSCHEKTDGEQFECSSSCQILCAAMSNLIIADMGNYPTINKVSAEIGFFLKNSAKRSQIVELHPPK